MLKMNAQRSTLVLVDYQARLMPAIDRAGEVLTAAVQLARAARALGIRVIGTEQNPARLGPNDPAVRQLCDLTLPKMHFDACADGLAALLNEARQPGAAPAEVVVAGCEAHVCLLQTALGLAEHGHRVWVVESACGSRHEADRRAAMRRLRDAGLTLVTAEMVLFEWAATCEHPAFKRILQLVKEPGAA